MPDLSLNKKKELLALARLSIKEYLLNQKMIEPSEGQKEFEIKKGVFVTLKISGRLRGCIGTFDDEQTLFNNVTRMAVAAAFSDPRFEPLREDELGTVRIEISVLGEMVKMKELNELIIGRHGIRVHYQGSSGTYLPDVAVSQNWSKKEFIEHCVAEKAGKFPEKLEDVEVFLYEVDKFSEDNM